LSFEPLFSGGVAATGLATGLDVGAWDLARTVVMGVERETGTPMAVATVAATSASPEVT
jgi:hypothetical protein